MWIKSNILEKIKIFYDKEKPRQDFSIARCQKTFVLVINQSKKNHAYLAPMFHAHKFSGAMV